MHFIKRFGLVLFVLAAACFASDDVSVPQTGVENIASADLETGVWWATEYENHDEPSAAERDPLEPMNRAFFFFNRVADGLVLKPLAILYRDTLPDVAQTGVRNVVNNAFTPLSVVNYTLQGEGEMATRAFFSFFVNTTFGFFGLFNIAKEIGLEVPATTLNETFASWGVEAGPYLMIPLIGPSSFRGAYGKLGDWFINPMRYVVDNKHRQNNRHRQQRYIMWALYGLDLIDRRAKLIEALNDIEKNAFDPYVMIRSIFFQKEAEMEANIKKRHEKERAFI